METGGIVIVSAVVAEVVTVLHRALMKEVVAAEVTGALCE
jgi:hypothetical protein